MMGVVRTRSGWLSVWDSNQELAPVSHLLRHSLATSMLRDGASLHQLEPSWTGGSHCQHTLSFHSAREGFVELFGVPADVIVVIMNWRASERCRVARRDSTQVK